MDDVPGLVIWSAPAARSTRRVNYTGFPTDEDPYANPQLTGPQAALITASSPRRRTVRRRADSASHPLPGPHTRT